MSLAAAGLAAREYYVGLCALRCILHSPVCWTGLFIGLSGVRADGTISSAQMEEPNRVYMLLLEYVLAYALLRT